MQSHSPCLFEQTTSLPHTGQSCQAYALALLQSLSGQRGPVFALAWSPDGSLLASGGVDGGIRLWELSGAQLTTLRALGAIEDAAVNNTQHAP